MRFSQIKYPQNQIYKIDLLSKKIDQLFFDVEKCNRRVLVEKSMLDDLKVSSTQLKEVYEVDDKQKILRFDHTHVFFLDNLLEDASSKNLSFNESKVGPVFRKEPTEKDRYREFFQYDLDYFYDTHNYRPLKILIRFLNRNFFKILINDNTIEDEPDKEKKIKDKYKDLFEFDNVFYSSDIKRELFYSGLTFEVYYKDASKISKAIGGGGTYIYNDRKYFGFSIGLNRLISAIELNEKLIEQYFPLKPLILIFFKGKTPSNLLDALEASNLPYHLERYTSPLIRKALKCSKKLLEHRKQRKFTLIVDQKEDEKKTYTFKEKKAFEKKQYTLEELTEYFKKQLL